jgi:hypothetical protein
MVQEAYCALGQKVAERLEDVSDTMADQRYRAKRRAEHSPSIQPPAQHVIDVTDYHVINGFKHTN